MSPSSMQENKSAGKLIFLIVLLLTVLPLVLFILVQFAPPREAGSSAEPVPSGETTVSKRNAASEHRAARQDVKTTHTANVPHGMASVSDNTSVVGVGAVVPNAPRSKQATPYEPGTVPGDSGVGRPLGRGCPAADYTGEYARDRRGGAHRPQRPVLSAGHPESAQPLRKRVCASARSNSFFPAALCFRYVGRCIFFADT